VPFSPPDFDEPGASLPTPGERASRREREGAPQAAELGPVTMARKAKLRATLFDEAPIVSRFGRYLTIGPLGRGGMGTVLEAFDPTLDRRVAVKLLHTEIDDHHAQRLIREARALARLSHPNVVQVYEAGQIEGRSFVTMELVRGRTLQQWAQQEPRPGWKACVELYLQAGSGLAAAHARGLVHRDFKPSNAIVDDEGRVRVLDFGLARRAESSEDERPWEELESSFDRSGSDASLTTTGMVLGTLAYMPPEQMRGREADARSDQFSFCVSLFEAVHGVRPYEGSSLPGLMLSMTTGTLKPTPTGRKIPVKLRRVLMRGLAFVPEQRWPSMNALLAELQRLVAPRARRWLGLGLGLVGGVATVGMAWYAEVGLRCEGAQAQLHGIWDEARAQELEAAFMGTGVHHAAETWARVRARLDVHAEDWVAKHTEVCEATRVTEAQPEAVMALRMSCLSSQRLELRAAVNVLARADPTRVGNAMELVESLPEPSRCDDIEALRAELPPPDDVQVAAEVEMQRERLAEARALRVAGDYHGAATMADAVVERARALGYGPLQVEALLRRGQARGSGDDHAQAVEDLEQAYSLAEEHEHARAELEAVSELVYVVGHQQGSYERARPWQTVALAIAKRKRTDSRAKAEALHAVGVVLVDERELEDALVLLQEALELQQQAPRPQLTNVANLLQLIGTALMRQDRWDEALDHQQRALVIRERASGPHHPSVAAALTDLANVLEGQGRLQEALTHHRRALAIFEGALGPRHSSVAIAESNIGALLDLQGNQEEALVHHHRALAIREASLGPRHPEVAIALGNLAGALQGQGKHQEALPLFLRALDIQHEALGPHHPDIAAMSSNIGLSLAALGRYDEALVHHRRALAIAEHALAPDHSTIALLLVNLGDALVGHAELEAAGEAYQRALAIAEPATGPDHPMVAYALVGLAEVALAQHDPAAALPHAERAAAIRERGEVMPSERAQTRFLLARALESDHGARARARALAEQARDDYAAHRQGNEERLAEVLAWLGDARVKTTP
jgi:tetratricopeptide (TPR) repeat protein